MLLYDSPHTIPRSYTNEKKQNLFISTTVTHHFGGLWLWADLLLKLPEIFIMLKVLGLPCERSIEKS